MPDSMSKERIRILEAYGAKVVLTPGEKNMGGANEKAAEILEQTENAIITGQGGNHPIRKHIIRQPVRRYGKIPVKMWISLLQRSEPVEQSVEPGNS